MPFWSIARKDLRTILRDKAGAFMFFILPLVFLFVFGAAFSGRSTSGKSPFKVLVSNEDEGKRGAAMVQAMQQVGLTVEPDAGGAASVQRRVEAGEVAVGVMLPPEFSAQVEQYARQGAGGAKPTATQMRVAVDPAQSQAAGMAKGALFAAFQRVTGPLYREAALARIPPAYRKLAAKQMTASGDANAMPFQFSQTGQQNSSAAGAGKLSKAGENASDEQPHITTGDIITPGFAVYFVFFLANSVATSLLMERQEGTLRRMLSAPIARSHILLGKLLARGLLGLLQTLMLFGVAALLLHAHYGSSPLGIVLVALSTIFAATGMGLLIATFAKTPEQIQSFTTLVLLVMGAVSGCLMPRMFLPESVQKFSLVTPHAWALTAYQDLMLRGRSVTDVLPAIGVVIGFGIGFYVLALARFRYE